MIVMSELSCISYGFSGGMRIMSGSSAIDSKFVKTPVKVLRRLVLANCHVFPVFEDKNNSHMLAFFIDAAVM